MNLVEIGLEELLAHCLRGKLGDVDLCILSGYIGLGRDTDVCDVCVGRCICTSSPSGLHDLLAIRRLWIPARDEGPMAVPTLGLFTVTLPLLLPAGKTGQRDSVGHGCGNTGV